MLIDPVKFCHIMPNPPTACLVTVYFPERLFHPPSTTFLPMPTITMLKGHWRGGL